MRVDVLDILSLSEMHLICQEGGEGGSRNEHSTTITTLSTGNAAAMAHHLGPRFTNTDLEALAENIRSMRKAKVLFTPVVGQMVKASMESHICQVPVACCS